MIKPIETYLTHEDGLVRDFAKHSISAKEKYYVVENYKGNGLDLKENTLYIEGLIFENVSWIKIEKKLYCENHNLRGRKTSISCVPVDSHPVINIERRNVYVWGGHFLYGVESSKELFLRNYVLRDDFVPWVPWS